MKAKLDGEYVKRVGFWFDLRCFFGTFLFVLRSEGVVEGGTGEIKKQSEPKTEGETCENEECGEEVESNV